MFGRRHDRHWRKKRRPTSLWLILKYMYSLITFVHIEPGSSAITLCEHCWRHLCYSTVTCKVIFALYLHVVKFNHRAYHEVISLNVRLGACKLFHKQFNLLYSKSQPIFVSVFLYIKIKFEKNYTFKLFK